MSNNLIMLAGAVACLITCGLDLALYLVLVPMKNNPGAKRLLFLLSAIFSLLVITVLRITLGDWVGREIVVSALFWILAVSMVFLGVHIWRGQVDGARDYKRNHPSKR